MRLLRIADVARARLQWVQPHALSRRFELRHGDDIVARLDFRSAFGSMASGESADGLWTFKRVGFWRTRVTVRADGSDDNVAVFEPATWSGGGTLHLPGGDTLRATTSFWRTTLEFQATDDVPLVRYDTHGLVRLAADVTVLPEGARMPALPWVVMLGWYLIVLMHEDSSAAAVVATMG
jgi:hypothetical protein